MSGDGERCTVLRITLHEVPPASTPEAATRPNRVSVEIGCTEPLESEAELTIPYHAPSGERRTITARPEPIGRELAESGELYVYRLTADVPPGG